MALKLSDLTIIEISQRVGYANESYFFRVFKDAYQMTPRQYIQQNRRAEDLLQ